MKKFRVQINAYVDLESTSESAALGAVADILAAVPMLGITSVYMNAPLGPPVLPLIAPPEETP